VLTEPRIDRAVLLRAVRDLYGVPVEELRFIPVGWASAAYEVRTPGGSYFLKLWSRDHDAREAIARLPLVQQLHQVGFRARVPYPLVSKTDGVSASIPGGTIALFPFLPGRTPENWPRWPDAVLDEIGRTLADLHAATPMLTVPLPRERFSLAVGDELRFHLSDRAVRPQRAAVMDQLDRLESLQTAVRREPPEYVVCHTDLLGDNLLVDDHGRLSALDWDEATLAPPERDLAVLLLGEQPVDGRVLRRVLSVYPPEVPLSVDLFAFFLLRRYIEDYTARVVRLHEGDLDPVHAEDALDGMRRWGSAQWERLDQTLSIVRDCLRERLQ
jgi:Ser/Thr protein kinase RdoA (MazF antagonist)